MAPIRTTLVRKRHPWTGEDLPWNIDVEDSVVAALPEDRRAGWRLFHYLSGSGMRAFAGSAMREVVSRRQTRFLWSVAALALVWLVFRFI